MDKKYSPFDEQEKEAIEVKKALRENKDRFVVLSDEKAYVVLNAKHIVKCELFWGNRPEQFAIQTS